MNKEASSMIAQAQPKEDIWAEYCRNRSMELRNELILSYIHIVKYIVLRILTSYGGYPDMDDLMSYGILGLIDAVEKYDAEKGAKFETYASLRIKGAIIDQLRKQDWVPRSLRAKVRDIKECYESLEARSGKQATDEEVAEKLNMGVDELQKTLMQSYTFQVISLDEQIMETVRWDSSIRKEDANPEHEYVDKELREILTEHINRLSEKERLVLTLYYYEELTLKEIGKVLGVSESRVCQIHSKALMRLRTNLEKVV
jgi:RNA polymerase sigma factor for flagellar operon FliA